RPPTVRSSECGPPAASPPCACRTQPDLRASSESRCDSATWSSVAPSRYAPGVDARHAALAADLDAFVDAGETRFVYAAWKDDPKAPLRFLPDGAAVADRALAKAELQCFMPGCDTPAI